jgi:hypothetical protein
MVVLVVVVVVVHTSSGSNGGNSSFSCSIPALNFNTILSAVMNLE